MTAPTTSALFKLSTRVRVVFGYVVREMKQHKSGARLGLFFTVLEALVAILVLALLFSVIGRRAAFGDSLILFMMTGFAPFLTFTKTSSKASSAVLQGTNRGRSPMLSIQTYAITQTIIVVFGLSTAVTIICMTLYGLGVAAAVPIDLSMIILSFLVAAALGYGVGLLNSIIGFFFKPWHSIYQLMTRGLLFLSGIFYVADFMPVQIREIIEWNPLIHVISLFRYGFYSTYPDVIFDQYYLFCWVIISVFLGIFFERLMRRSIFAQ